MEIVFTFVNSADPDEMLQDSAFHLGLHYLSKYPLCYLEWKGLICIKQIWLQTI